MVPRSRRIWAFIAIALVVNLALSAILSRPAERMSVPYTFFRQQVEAGNVKEVTSQGDSIQGDFRKATAPPGAKGGPKKKFSTVQPSIRPRQPRPTMMPTPCAPCTRQLRSVGALWWAMETPTSPERLILQCSSVGRPA